ncbi:hypothetical protein N7G274_001770 [Stereocaulon virgatum]|uniref:Uncharacterized protein n=1 Tax=Stereocaulon virgatum TaxID=373712 RepID=A0ABR4AMH6_9LECA
MSEWGKVAAPAPYDFQLPHGIYRIATVKYCHFGQSTFQEYKGTVYLCQKSPRGWAKGAQPHSCQTFATLASYSTGSQSRYWKSKSIIFAARRFRRRHSLRQHLVSIPPPNPPSASQHSSPLKNSRTRLHFGLGTI